MNRIHNYISINAPYICIIQIIKVCIMGEICHNCKSEDTFFDGELYQCIHCRYMWVPEKSVKSLKPQNPVVEEPKSPKKNLAEKV